MWPCKCLLDYSQGVNYEKRQLFYNNIQRVDSFPNYFLHDSSLNVIIGQLIPKGRRKVFLQMNKTLNFETHSYFIYSAVGDFQKID